MSELPFGDLLPATFKGARTLRALMALIAASLLAACGTGNGGYQQGYVPCPGSATGYCNPAAPSYYGFAAPGPATNKPGFYPLDFGAYGNTGRQQPVYQTPPSAPPQTPPANPWFSLGSTPAAAAETFATA
jgi:hypothetical protein